MDPQTQALVKLQKQIGELTDLIALKNNEISLLRNKLHASTLVLDRIESLCLDVRTRIINDLEDFRQKTETSRNSGNNES